MFTDTRKDLEEHISVDRQHRRIRRAQKGEEGREGPAEGPEEPVAGAGKGQCPALGRGEGLKRTGPTRFLHLSSLQHHPAAG